MNPDEQKLLEIGTNALLQPYHKAMENMLGPTSKTFGLLLNSLVSRQLFNAVKACDQALTMAKKAGLDLGNVPLKVLKPILDGAALEDDEKMKELWAALLANAADIRKEDGRELSPSFPEALKRLSSRDALVLNRFFENEAKKTLGEYGAAFDDEIRPAFPEFTTEQLYDALHNLVQAGIVNFEAVKWESVSKDESHSERRYHITPFGGRFVHACRPPKEASQAKTATTANNPIKHP